MVRTVARRASSEKRVLPRPALVRLFADQTIIPVLHRVMPSVRVTGCRCPVAWEVAGGGWIAQLWQSPSKRVRCALLRNLWQRHPMPSSMCAFENQKYTARTLPSSSTVVVHTRARAHTLVFYYERITCGVGGPRSVVPTLFFQFYFAHSAYPPPPASDSKPSFRYQPNFPWVRHRVRSTTYCRA